MVTKRALGLIISAAVAVTVGTAVTVTSVTGANASPPTSLGLNPPGLHPRAAADPAPTATGGPNCGYVAAVPADRFKGIPVFNAAAAAQPFDLQFFTNQGIITVKMLTDAAPCTTWSFRFLASRGYFNGTHCHRLTEQGIFVLQCGDPTGTGSGGPGYQFNDENLSGATYPAGTVAMANAGPNTNGSQFFFVWKDSTALAPNYTPFGTVVGGMDVLQKIADAGDDSQNGTGDGYPNLYTQFFFVRVDSGNIPPF